METFISPVAPVGSSNTFRTFVLSLSAPLFIIYIYLFRICTDACHRPHIIAWNMSFLQLLHRHVKPLSQWYCTHVGTNRAIKALIFIWSFYVHSPSTPSFLRKPCPKKALPFLKCVSHHWHSIKFCLFGLIKAIMNYSFKSPALFLIAKSTNFSKE